MPSLLHHLLHLTLPPLLLLMAALTEEPPQALPYSRLQTASVKVRLLPLPPTSGVSTDLSFAM